MTSETRDYGGRIECGKFDVVKGCSPRRVSRSAYEYLQLKGMRDGAGLIASMFNDSTVRYGEKATPSTRRTSHDDNNRKRY